MSETLEDADFNIVEFNLMLLDALMPYSDNERLTLNRLNVYLAYFLGCNLCITLQILEPQPKGESGE